MTDQPQTTERNEFVCGYAAALAALVRLRDMPTVARDIAQCDGLTLRNFKDAGVEEFDLCQIKKAFTS